MIKIILFALLLTCISCINAQQIFPDLECSASGTLSNGTTNLYWTIGETIIATLKTPSSSVSLTSGFNQNKYVITALSNNLSRNIKLYPNPANDMLIIQSDNTIKNGRFQLFDLNGKMVKEGDIQNDITKISCSEWTPAMYLLKISNASNSVFGTFKIIKL
ncbi:MAG: hypothetical protein JWN78_240 [Bacteroidota bacterium]|nr:hypothetical protein [Bacteroidota bacterium]